MKERFALISNFLAQDIKLQQMESPTKCALEAVQQNTGRSDWK
jgi:hypothetical protein